MLGGIDVVSVLDFGSVKEEGDDPAIGGIRDRTKKKRHQQTSRLAKYDTHRMYWTVPKHRTSRPLPTPWAVVIGEQKVSWGAVQCRQSKCPCKECSTMFIEAGVLLLHTLRVVEGLVKTGTEGEWMVFPPPPPRQRRLCLSPRQRQDRVNNQRRQKVKQGHRIFLRLALHSSGDGDLICAFDFLGFIPGGDLRRRA